MSKINVTSIDYHRNGVSGVGFYACHFDDPENGKMMAVVFPPDVEGGSEEPEDWPTEFHNPRVAVFQEEKLPGTEFGVNSWRGDNYADALYAAIREAR